MAESADDPALYWVEPRDARHHPARRLPRAVAAGAHRARGSLHASRRPRLRRRHRRLRRRRARTAPDLDQRAHPPALWRPASTSATATRSRPTTDGALVGGLYGVASGRAFFGESMFRRERDASKVALVHLVARLRAGGFRLLDTQFVTAASDELRRGRRVAPRIPQAARPRPSGMPISTLAEIDRRQGRAGAWRWSSNRRTSPIGAAKPGVAPRGGPVRA